jgi:hypothetical protein
MNRAPLISGLTILLLTGCTDSQLFDNQLVSYATDENYLNFNHPYTDKAVADVLARAERICGERKQMAIQTSKICSLTKCTTNYQCVDAANVIKYGL